MMLRYFTNQLLVQLYLFSNFNINTLGNGSGTVNAERFRCAEVLPQTSFQWQRSQSIPRHFCPHKPMRGDAGVRKDSCANVVLSSATIILDFHLYSDLADELEKTHF